MDNELFNFQKNAIMGKIAQPLCAEYKAAWRQCGDDKESLIRLALQQQSLPYVSSACYRNLGVSKKYLVDNFKDYINGRKVFEDVEGIEGYKYEMYVGFNDSFVAKSDVTNLMWCNDTLINVEESKCPLFYVSNNSDVHFVLNGYNSIRIYLFDESKVVIEDADDTCDVIVYKYGNRAEVELGRFCLGKVKIFNKQLKL